MAVFLWFRPTLTNFRPISFDYVFPVKIPIFRPRGRVRARFSPSFLLYKPSPWGKHLVGAAPRRGDVGTLSVAGV